MKYAKWIPVLLVMAICLLTGDVAFAEGGEDFKGYIGLGMGLGMGFAVLGAGIGQGMAARGMYESVSRNPAAAGKLNAPFYVGMAFIESLVIFTFVVAIFLNGALA